MGKYIQDQESPVDSPEPQLALQLLLDVRTEFVVEDDHIGTGLPTCAYEFGELAFTDVVSGVRLVQLLADALHCLDSHTAGQLLQFVQGRIDVNLRVGGLDADEDRLFDRAASGLRSVLSLFTSFGLDFGLL